MTAPLISLKPLPEGHRVEDRNDAAFIRKHYADHWLADFMVLRGRIIRAEDVRALVVCDRDGVVRAATTWRFEGLTASIVTHDSFAPGEGLGSHLIVGIIERAREAGCRALSVWMLNDCLRAMRYFQLRGFRFRSIWPGGVDMIRELKPRIPVIGEGGIPVLDEIEMEMEL